MVDASFTRQNWGLERLTLSEWKSGSYSHATVVNGLIQLPQKDGIK